MIGSIQKTIERYLRSEDNIRVKTMLNGIKDLGRYHHDKATLSAKIEGHIQMLNQHPYGTAIQPIEIEILPFEWLLRALVAWK